MQSVLPWYPRDLLQRVFDEPIIGEFDGLDDVQPQALVPEFIDDRLSLQETLPTPGLLHIVHDASNDLLGCMSSLDASVDDLTVVCRFLSNRHSHVRVVSTCFDCPLGRPYKRFVETFW